MGTLGDRQGPIDTVEADAAPYRPVTADLLPLPGPPAPARASDDFEPAGPVVEAATISSPPKGAVWHATTTWVQGHPVQAGRLVAGALAAVAVGAAVFAVAVPRTGGTAVAEARPAAAVDPTVVRVATARLPLVDVFENPQDAVAAATLEHPTANGSPLVFAVLAEWEGWLKVITPGPPAGSSGWVRTGDVETSEHQTRITVDLDQHLLVVREAGEIVLRAPVAVGRHDKPAAGTTYVTGRAALPESATRYGAHVLTLAGYANGQDTFFRGSGLVGIHALGDPLDLGQTVTDGSIGLAPADAERVFELAPLGTPVDVVADA